jgi:hypothetical protein
MSSRIEWARKVRAAVRQNKGENPYKEQTLEMDLSAAVAVILCLLFIGAAIATTYIRMSSPGCMDVGVRGSGASAMSAMIHTKTDVTPPSPPVVPVATLEPVKVQTVASAIMEAPAPAGSFPSSVPNCSAPQMQAILKQLSPNNCFSNAFTQACSFTIATIKSGCVDTTAYFRQPLATMKLTDPFTAVLIGVAKKDDTPMDLLALGSHNPDKYKVALWRTTIGGADCSGPDGIAFETTPQQARLFVIEDNALMASQMKEYKNAVGLTDGEMRGDTTYITRFPQGDSAKTLTGWVQQTIPQGDIHYMRLLVTRGRDYDILLSGAGPRGGPGGVLERVWYVEFGLDWKDGWEDGSLKLIVTNALNSFACYWHGAGGNLWRISGCWHSHYDFKSWAKVVCVNTKIEAAKPFYEKMEHAFAETLKKDLSFGAA